MSGYLTEVIKSLRGSGVVMPRIARFLEKEAMTTAKDSTNKKRIVQKDAILTIRCMRHRHAEFAHGTKKRPTFAFHPSALGMCQRQLWFEHFKAPRARRHRDDAVSTYLTFEIGSYLHIIIQNLCERAGILVKREHQLYDAEACIEGTCDGILNIDGTTYVLEIKSINSGQWTKVQHAPKFEHKQQAMAYMYVLDIQWTSILYVNKDRSAVKEHLIPFDQSFFKEHVERRIITYKTAVRHRTLPPREGTGPTTFPCSFCPYTSICFTQDLVDDFVKRISLPKA